MTQSKLPTNLIPQLLQSPRKIGGEYVYLKSLTGQGRWQIIVPQRLSKTKVEHNRLKRRLREAVMAQSPQIDQTDLLFVARRNFSNTSFDCLAREVVYLLTQARKWQGRGAAN